MTQPEEFPGGYEAVASAAETVFLDDGALNEAFIASNFGLGVEEAMQAVSYGKYTGTLAQMLADETCPVSGMLREAYAEKGIDGVVEQFQGLSMLSKASPLKVSEATLEREQLKKNFSSELALKPEVERAETPQKAIIQDKVKVAEAYNPKAPSANREKIADETSLRDRILIAEDLLRRANEESKTNKVEPASVLASEPVPKIVKATKDSANLAKEDQKPAAKQTSEPVAVTMPTKAVPKPITPAQMTPKKSELAATATTMIIEKPAEPKAEIAHKILAKPEKDAEPDALEEQVAAIVSEPPTAEIVTSADLEAADLEGWFESFEIETPDELLSNSFEETVDVAATDPEAAFSAELMEALQAALLEPASAEDEPTNPQTTFFASYLETLEPAQAEEVQGILEVLGNDIKFLNLDLEFDDAEREAVVAEMYRLTERLLSVLGIVYDEETIKRFIENVSSAEVAESPSLEQLSVDYLNGKGTQEYKSDISSHLATRLTKIKIPAHQFLAKYILQIALA